MRPVSQSVIEHNPLLLKNLACRGRAARRRKLLWDNNLQQRKYFPTFLKYVPYI